MLRFLACSSVGVCSNKETEVSIVVASHLDELCHTCFLLLGHQRILLRAWRLWNPDLFRQLIWIPMYVLIAIMVLVRVCEGKHKKNKGGGSIVTEIDR